MDDVSYSGEKKPIWKRISKRTVLIIVILLITLGLIGGVAYFATKDTPPEDTKTIELPPETDSGFEDQVDEDLDEEIKSADDTDITPIPDDDANADGILEREDISVSVQNGSGESGVAGEAADILREAGYEVVSTGNADNFEYEDVTIQVKASSDNALGLLEEDLSDTYTIGETSTDLSEDESFDALVIIGV